MHGPETGIIPRLDEIAFQVFQGSCFFLKARLPASSDDDNVFLNAARMRLQRGNEKTKAIERLCAARRWMPDAIFSFHFWLRFFLIFNRWSHFGFIFNISAWLQTCHWLWTKFRGLGACLSWRFPVQEAILTCPKVIAHANRLMDAPVVHLILFINIHVSIHACFPIIAANQGENDVKEGLIWYFFRPDMDIDSLDKQLSCCWLKFLSIGKGWKGNKSKTPFLVLRKSSWLFWNSALSQLPLVLHFRLKIASLKP